MKVHIEIGRPRWVPKVRGRTKVAAAIAVLGLVGAPAAVWANDRFPDVPPGSGHDEISTIDDAGIVRGCGNSGNYCPDEPVTRKQMAQFLARTGSSASVAPVSTTVPVATGATVGTTDVTVPGLPGETQYVSLHATVDFAPDPSDIADCTPCWVEFWLQDGGGRISPSSNGFVWHHTPTEVLGESATVSVDFVFDAPSGSDQTYLLKARRPDLPGPDPTLGISGALTATTHPFTN